MVLFKQTAVQVAVLLVMEPACQSYCSTYVCAAKCYLIWSLVASRLRLSLCPQVAAGRVAACQSELLTIRVQLPVNRHSAPSESHRILPFIWIIHIGYLRRRTTPCQVLHLYFVSLVPCRLGALIIDSDKGNALLPFYLLCRRFTVRSYML